jgi:hypothetical protein
MEVFYGIGNASAAEALGRDHFVVADDESKSFHVYRFDAPDAEPARIPLSAVVRTKISGEPDLEGAARHGDLIYWIGSHGRDDKGRPAPGRSLLFATRIVADGVERRLMAEGEPFRGLLEAMAEDKDVARALGLPKALSIAPKKPGGISIEGLACDPKGRLLVGFRNPLSAGRAVVIRLKNPLALLHGEAPRFSRPRLLDLGGRGIRSIEWVETLGQFLVIAGPVHREAGFALYRWSGRRRDSAVELDGSALLGLNPEALFVRPESGTVMVLSDDGRKLKDGEGEVASFRAVELDLAQEPS